MLEENWLTVQVFRRCKPQWLGTLKPVYAGIASTEIESACRLLKVPPDSWDEISEGVQVMEQATAAAYRERTR